MTSADKLREMIREAEGQLCHARTHGAAFSSMFARGRLSALSEALNVLTTSYAASATDEHYDAMVIRLCEGLQENGGGSTPALALPGEFDNVLEIARHRVAEREVLKVGEKEDG